MSELRAFKLRANFEDFSGGTVCYGSQGLTFDIGKALKGGDTFVVDDVWLAEALTGYEALESVEVPPGAKPISLEVTEESTDQGETFTSTTSKDKDPPATDVPIAAIHGDPDELESPKGPHDAAHLGE